MPVQLLLKNVWAITGAVNMGLVAVDGGLVVIDTGLDKSAAKTLRQAADSLGQPLIAVINTHAHADHFGGNADLLRRFDLTVYAPEGEAAVIRRPRFEPEYLWYGAKPLPEMNSKFLMAAPSRVDVELAADAVWEIGGTEFQAIPMFGHAHGQVAIRVNDVLFAADSYFDANVVDKHGIPYFVDWGETMVSAARVGELEAAWVLPGHGQATKDATAAVEYYRDRLQHIYEQTLQVLSAEPRGLDDIVAAVCSQFGVEPNGAGPYTLVRTPISACLTDLVAAGEAAVVVTDARLQFIRTTAGDC